MYERNKKLVNTTKRDTREGIKDMGEYQTPGARENQKKSTARREMKIQQV